MALMLFELPSRLRKKKGRAFRLALLSLTARTGRLPITFGYRRSFVRFRVTLRDEATGNSAAVLCDLLSHDRLLAVGLIEC